MAICDQCRYNCLDDESGEYYCSAELDEDELVRFLSGSENECGFYMPYDEYKMVQKQN